MKVKQIVIEMTMGMKMIVLNTKRKKEKAQCSFHMIENIAQKMKKLENIVTDYYSDSEKSENLSERQQKRLERLKQKRAKKKK